MTSRKVFDRLYAGAAEHRERRRVEHEKHLAERSRAEEESMRQSKQWAGKMERKQSDKLFERLYNGYAARQRHIDEQREEQAREFIEMAQPGGSGRRPDIEHINRLYEDYRGRQRARREAFMARQREIDRMARGSSPRPRSSTPSVWEKLYREQEKLSERRRLRIKAAEEEDRRMVYRTIVTVPKGMRLSTPRCFKLTKGDEHCPVTAADDAHHEENDRSPLGEAEVQARVASLYKDALDRRERQKDRMERKQLLELAADIRATCGGTNGKPLALQEGAEAAHERLYHPRFAPPSRVSKTLARDECWEQFNTKACSVHAGRQLSSKDLAKTFNRLYSDSVARAKRQEERRLAEDIKTRELQEEATRRPNSKRRRPAARKRNGNDRSFARPTARPGRVYSTLAATAGMKYATTPASSRVTTDSETAVQQPWAECRFLVEEIRRSSELELAFVWNRSYEKVEAAIRDGRVPAECALRDLGYFADTQPDLIAEVCHPDVAREWCCTFLSSADVYIGSPTAFADEVFEQAVRTTTVEKGRSVYISVGALWGAEDIRRMDAQGKLRGLTVTMKKHPESLKLTGSLMNKMASLMDGRQNPSEDVVIYEGDVRPLCPLAPNNVNTMACAAIAAPSLGFSRVRARLVANSSLIDRHIVAIDVDGPFDNELGCAFKVGAESQLFAQKPVASELDSGQVTHSREAREAAAYISL
ncbi:hypothetical protein FOZ61_003250 [Perkinsus olseni]|uniref:Aspartate dehydrogenase domain-containing protein n=1 Tax=Perkinsus olseni TaxID=32597 RepID=A0A7J6MIQ9_PEROL|nr:hypothetical protein FOZ61_003250 [Perkinsus olseni]